MRSDFKWKNLKQWQKNLIAAGVAAGLVAGAYFASKPLGELYDKVVIENYAAESVVNYLDGTYNLPTR